MPSVQAAGRSLNYEWVGGGRQGAPVLVFLHEGLGSIRQWRDFPAKVAQATGLSRARVRPLRLRPVGCSSGIAQRTVRFMHDEALAVPSRTLLQDLKIENPILRRPFRRRLDCADPRRRRPCGARRGRDGAARLHRAAVPDARSTRPRTAFETTDLARKARHATIATRARPSTAGPTSGSIPGSRAGTSATNTCRRSRCPVLAIQGDDDEYGTMAQLDDMARRVEAPASC